MFRYRSLFLLMLIIGMALPMIQAQEANLTAECVEAYDASVDYFPNKATVEYATGFAVEYFSNYKVVTLTSPWRGAEEAIQYVLVQCGTPAPDGFEEATVIEVPIQSMVAMSTTYLPHLENLGRVDSLVALDSFDYVNTASVRERIDAGELEAVGFGSEVNVEVVLDLDPDLVMVYGSGFPEYDAHPKLIEAGIPVALSSDYLETTPLGQAEWGKFVALFFNEEAQATATFENVVTKYQGLQALVADVTERPTVFTGSTYDGTTWYVPGGNSYTAQLLADAGADYIFAETASDESFNITMDVEVVVEEAAAADFWVNPDQVFWNTSADVLAADERFAEFAALENGQLYNNNAITTAGGGSDYYESGVANPQVILADLIAIFHPELLPDHELTYYKQVQ